MFWITVLDPTRVWGGSGSAASIEAWVIPELRQGVVMEQKKPRARCTNTGSIRGCEDLASLAGTSGGQSGSQWPSSEENMATAGSVGCQLDCAEPGCQHRPPLWLSALMEAVSDGHQLEVIQQSWSCSLMGRLGTVS